LDQVKQVRKVTVLSSKASNILDTSLWGRDSDDEEEPAPSALFLVEELPICSAWSELTMFRTLSQLSPGVVNGGCLGICPEP
jgi:hypothetical protein